VRRLLSAFFHMILGMLFGLAGGLLLTLYVLFLYLWAGEAPFAAKRTTFLSTVLIYLLGGIITGGLAGLLGPLGRGRIWAAIVGFVALLPVTWGMVKFGMSDMGDPTPTALLTALALGAPLGLAYRALFGDLFTAGNENSPPRQNG
jgi:hypothetical protein